MRTRILSAIFLHLVFGAGILFGAEQDKTIVGVKLPRLTDEPEAVAEALADARINTVFAGQRARESKELIRLCQGRDIEFYAIFGVFVDAAAIEDDPSLSQINALGKPMTAKRKSYRLVCPNRDDYRRRKIEMIVSYLKEHDVDGLSLDFIRYGVEWEMIKPDETPGLDQEYCFCPLCLKKFGEIRELPSAGSVPDLARFILERHREEWTAFKCAAVTSMVQEIRDAAQTIKPDIKIAIHALPWTEEDYDDGARRLGGQDFGDLKRSVDLFSPMNYHYMLYREPGSIRRQVLRMKALGCRVAPCVQAGLIFRKDDGFTAEVFDEAVAQALQLPSDGINLYIWPIFSADPELKAVLIRNLEKRRGWEED